MKEDIEQGHSTLWGGGGGGMYWEKCGQRFGVAEMWHVPRDVTEWGDQRDVFRMKH